MYGDAVMARNKSSVQAKKININTATKEELASLPKIGEERAQTLIEERPFDSWDEIDELPGFDEGLIEDIQKGGGYLEVEEVEEEEWSQEEEEW
jgi:DNA uptake protein ComE-like DNA-binding protein